MVNDKPECRWDGRLPARHSVEARMARHFVRQEMATWTREQDRQIWTAILGKRWSRSSAAGALPGHAPSQHKILTPRTPTGE